jgi:hypothetical protein
VSLTRNRAGAQSFTRVILNDSLITDNKGADGHGAAGALARGLEAVLPLQQQVLVDDHFGLLVPFLTGCRLLPVFAQHRTYRSTA